MGTENLKPYDPAAADQTEADYSVKRPPLPEGYVMLRIVKPKHFPARGNQLSGKIFFQALVLEGTEEQAGKMTAGSIECPLLRFDEPKEGQVEFDSNGNPLLTEGQIQHYEICNIEWANFTGAFNVPKFPEARNEPSIQAWLGMLEGQDGLAKLTINKAHTYPKAGEDKNDKASWTGQAEDQQEIKYFRPFKRLDPKKGEVDELAIFRTKMGDTLKVHVPEGEEL